MNTERWQRVATLFERAADQAAAERAAFLAQACGEDESLRREVEAMLAADASFAAETGSLLAGSADAIASELLDEATPPPSLAGRRVGPYRLEREIGRGGMGAVYLARRDDVDLMVALKVSTGGLASPDRIARFQTERRVLARLEHASIARLLDAGVLGDGTPWFAMEYVPGQPLDRYCDEKRLTIEQRIDLFGQVCEAVMFAHRNLVVHRDLKPANILVTPEGVPKLLDFGIAKLLEAQDVGGAESAEPTREGGRLLTPEFAAPEQLLGEPVTTATDIYALGLLLYRLLAGTGPFPRAGASLFDVGRVLREDPPAPSSVLAEDDVAPARATTTARLRRQLEGELDAIVLKALAREPRQRYASTERFFEDLRAFRESRPIEARPATRMYRLDRFVRRNRGPVAAIAAVFAILSVSLAALAVQRAEIRRERDRARIEAARAGEVSDFLAGLFRASDPYQGAGAEMPVGELLEQGRQRVDDLSAQPELQASMLDVLGRVHASLGEYVNAQGLHARALDIRRRLHGEEHLDVALSMSAIGQAMSARGVLDSAAILQRDALHLAERVGATGSIEHADLLLQLGTLLHRNADYPGAVAHYRQALDIFEQRLSYPHLRIAQAQANLGLAHDGLRALEQAEFYKRESVATFEALPGDQSANLAQAYNNLAVTLERQGRLEEAEEIQRRTLDAKQASLPAGHPSIGVTMSNLASILIREGEYDEAEALYTDALALQRAALGPEHRYVLNALDGLADVARGRGTPDVAEARRRESLELTRRSLGAEHPRVATVLLDLGRLRRDLGDLAEAESLLRECVRIRENGLGAEAPQTAAARTALAAVLIDLRRFDEAEAQLDAVLRGARVTAASDTPNEQALTERLRLYQAWGREDRVAETRAALDANR